MPTNSGTTTFPRQDLASYVAEFMLDPSQYIGAQILPPMPVDEESGVFSRIPNEHLSRLQSTKRAAKGSYPRSDYEYETDTWECEEYGWEEKVDDRERNRLKNAWDADAAAAEIATHTILREYEKRVADLIFDTSYFGGATITNEWDDATNAVPINDINTELEAIRLATSIPASMCSLVVSETVWRNLGLCDQIVDRVKYVFPGVDMAQFTPQMLGKLFGLKSVLVGSAAYNSAKEGQAMSGANIWSNEYAFIGVIGASTNLKIPQVGRTFVWTTDAAFPLAVEQYREEQTRGDVIRVRMNTDEKRFGAMFGRVLDNVTT